MAYDSAVYRDHCGERRPWSDAERWVLVSLWDGHGKWWDGWAKALPGRTPDAIADQSQVMGLTWKRPRDKWAPEEDALLLRHIMEVSQETGRAPSSVASRVAVLRRSAKRADAERMVTR